MRSRALRLISVLVLLLALVWLVIEPGIEPVITALLGLTGLFGSSTGVGSEADEGSASPVSTDRRGIVVLPFDNLSADSGDAYISDGLTEEIITSLSLIEGLRVISRNSAMALKATQKDTITISRELGVRYLLEGSVRKSGDELRITAQLIDAETDDHVWSEQYEGASGSLFEIQAAVARAVAAELDIRMTPSEERALADQRIEDVVAYDCYLRARAELWLLSDTALDRALELVEKGLVHARGNPLLLVMEGEIHLQYVNTLSRPPESYDVLLTRAGSAADEALRADPRLPAALFLSGLVAHQRGDPVASIPAIHEAVRLAPDVSDYAEILGYQLAAAGAREGYARDLLRRAAALDPLTPMFSGGIGWWELFAGEFDAALEGWREWQAQLEETGSTFRLFLAWLNAAAGRVEESDRILDAIVADSRGHLMGSAAQFFRAALAGNRQEVVAGFTPGLAEACRWDDFYSLMAADAFALVDERDRAFHWLERAVDYGITNGPFLETHDPFLDGVRPEPRFQQVMERAESLAAAIERAVSGEKNVVGVSP